MTFPYTRARARMVLCSTSCTFVLWAESHAICITVLLLSLIAYSFPLFFLFFCLFIGNFRRRYSFYCFFNWKQYPAHAWCFLFFTLYCSRIPKCFFFGAFYMSVVPCYILQRWDLFRIRLVITVTWRNDLLNTCLRQYPINDLIFVFLGLHAHSNDYCHVFLFSVHGFCFLWFDGVLPCNLGGCWVPRELASEEYTRWVMMHWSSDRNEDLNGIKRSLWHAVVIFGCAFFASPSPTWLQFPFFSAVFFPGTVVFISLTYRCGAESD